MTTAQGGDGGPPLAWCAAEPLVTEDFELLDAHRRGILERADPARVHHDDLFQMRELIAHEQRLVELLLVLHHHDLRDRVGEDVTDLRFRARGVYADRDPADALGTEVREQPLRPVVGEHRDPVADPDAELAQPEAHPRGPPLVVGPAELLPPAQVLDPQRDGFGAGVGVAQQHRRQRDGGVRRRNGRDLDCRAHAGCPRYASITRASFWTSSGRPNAMGRPKSSASTRSAMSITRCMSCSTRMIDTASSALTWRLYRAMSS